MVPVEYEGLWRRSGIWRSNGSSDVTTQVWWFQATRYHIDLRIPVDRVGINGFAGETVVEGARCTWHPDIAYPALSGELDAGWMRFDDADHVHETGLDKSYDEDWYREPSGPMHGVRLTAAHGDQLAYLLISDEWMAWACGSPSGACDITVYRREQQQWTAIASNLPTPAHAVTLGKEQVLQWQAGDLIEVPMAPGSSYQVAGNAEPHRSLTS
ncbi:hypothetical protein Jab_1c11720 [Janthinobacterium sp. HH01]|uniref:hypothetical protein n=1 Tax=Janthinobacterium sp. HH01 TaxID=1198452 RepID=UPI0002AE7F6F|nr:hypothetical protein [Janthinobacterium sp. HH01]ELX12557.1 hypothetical protein Jab_1c11720 [Janthinobacterium sp. HH01]